MKKLTTKLTLSFLLFLERGYSQITNGEINVFADFNSKMTGVKNAIVLAGNIIVYSSVVFLCGSLIWLFVGGEQNGEKTKKILQTVAIVAVIVLIFSIIIKKVQF